LIIIVEAQVLTVYSTLERDVQPAAVPVPISALHTFVLADNTVLEVRRLFVEAEARRLNAGNIPGYTAPGGNQEPDCLTEAENKYTYIAGYMLVIFVASIVTAFFVFWQNRFTDDADYSSTDQSRSKEDDDDKSSRLPWWNPLGYFGDFFGSMLNSMFTTKLTAFWFIMLFSWILFLFFICWKR
jgi:hypothetical protein